MEDKQTCRQDFGVSMKTEVRVSFFTFNWRIDNLSKLSTGKTVKSATFQLVSNHEFYAEFKIDENFNGCVWFYCISGSSIEIKHNTTLIKNNGEVLQAYLYNIKSYNSNTSAFVLNISKEVMQKALKENALTIKSVMEFDETHHTSSVQNPVVSPLVDDMSALSRDLQTLYQSPVHQDIALRVGDCTVPANKCILAARSSVFARMFQTPMLETEKNIVDIPDLDSDTVRNLVSYLYTAVLPCDDFESASSLYYAGDKYNVPSLRAACRWYMLGKMDVQNACRVLVLADQHSDAEMRDQAMRFLDFCFEEVMKTESWTDLVKNSNGLAIEVLVLCSRRGQKTQEKKADENVQK